MPSCPCALAARDSSGRSSRFPGTLGNLVQAVTVGPYVVAVLTGFRGAEPDGTGRYRFSARLAGFTSDLVTPVQVVRTDVPGAAEARRLLGRRLDSESGGPVAYVRSGAIGGR